MSTLSKKLISFNFLKLCSRKWSPPVIRHLNRSCRLQRPTVCVVGSGPAGFGITQYLLKNRDDLEVKMLEKCAIPYGLIRYGVSPDHQDVKNCINGYEKVAENPRFSFYGGVEAGKCVSLQELSKISDAIVLCTGAQRLQRLSIVGENLKNVFSANEFVGWYNGFPEYHHITPDLTGKTAVVIGVGNVALDCARMLLKPHESLKDTDITEQALGILEKSKIDNVVLVGRRGPLQMACTRRELAEITELSDVHTDTDQSCFTEEVRSALKVKNLKLRKTQRLVKHLIEESREPNLRLNAEKKFTIKLLRSPLKICGSTDKVESIVLRNNLMSGEDAFNPNISPSNETETVDCSIIISAIGYGNDSFDASIPFSEGRIQSSQGRIDHSLPLYACGWCKTGPKGVLGDTLNDCLVTGNTLIKDLERNMLHGSHEGTIEDFLTQKGIKYFSWRHWKVIDKYETDQGAISGKIREKIISYDDMSRVAFGNE